MQSSSNLNRFAGKSASFTPMQDDALLKAVEQYKIENEAISVNWKTVLCNLKRMRNGTIDWSQLGHKQLQKRYFHVKNTHAKKLRTQDRNANTDGTAHASPYTLSGLSDEEVELITPPASVEYMFSGVSAKTLLDPAYITSMGFRKRLLDVGITFRKFTELLAQNSGKLPAEWLEKLRNYNKPPLYDETKSFYRSQEKRRNVGIARVAATSSCNQSQQQSPSSHCSSTVVVTNMKGYPKAATSTRSSSERSSGDENILYPLEYKTAVHSDDDDDCVSIVSRSTSKKTNYDEYGNLKYGQMSEQCDAAGLPVDNKMDSKVSLVSEGEKEPEEENALFGKRSSVTMEAGINDKFTELFRTTKHVGANLLDDASPSCQMETVDSSPVAGSSSSGLPSVTRLSSPDSCTHSTVTPMHDVSRLNVRNSGLSVISHRSPPSALFANVAFHENRGTNPTLPIPSGYEAQHPLRVLTQNEWRRILQCTYLGYFQPEHAEKDEWENMLLRCRIVTTKAAPLVKRDFFRYAVPNLSMLMEYCGIQIKLLMAAMSEFSAITIFHLLEQFDKKSIISAIRRLLYEDTLSSELLSLEEWVAAFSMELLSRPPVFFHTSVEQHTYAKKCVFDEIYMSLSTK